MAYNNKKLLQLSMDNDIDIIALENNFSPVISKYTAQYLSSWATESCGTKDNSLSLFILDQERMSLFMYCAD